MQDTTCKRSVCNNGSRFPVCKPRNKTTMQKGSNYAKKRQQSPRPGASESLHDTMT